MNRYVLAAGLLLIVVNAVVLGGVAYNRAGDPVSSLQLTERELSLTPRYQSRQENSATSLTLRWRILDAENTDDFLYLSGRSPAWLTHGKLEQLGLDVETFRNRDDRHRYRAGDYAARANLVMEYDGETHRRALSRATRNLAELRRKAARSPEDENLAHRLERFQGEVEKLEKVYSRLYVIDAVAQGEALPEKYRDRDDLLLIQGEVGLMWRDKQPAGYVRRLLRNRVHVPLPWSETLSSLEGRSIRSAPLDTEVAPRYTAVLNTGRRFEPWIESVSLR